MGDSANETTTPEEVQRREDLETEASRLKREGVVFQKISPQIYPGMPYVTPRYIIESGLTKYSMPGLHNLVQSGVIAAHKVGSAWIIDPEGLQQLRTFEEGKINGKLPGWKPGQRKQKSTIRE